MSRKERFTPQEKEQACIDYIEGNRSRSEICRELYISTSTMNIPVRRVLPHENIQMVGLTTTELSNKTSNNWLNGIAYPSAYADACLSRMTSKAYRLDFPGRDRRVENK